MPPSNCSVGGARNRTKRHGTRTRGSGRTRQADREALVSPNEPVRNINRRTKLGLVRSRGHRDTGRENHSDQRQENLGQEDPATALPYNAVEPVCFAHAMSKLSFDSNRSKNSWYRRTPVKGYRPSKKEPDPGSLASEPERTR